MGAIPDIEKMLEQINKFKFYVKDGKIFSVRGEATVRKNGTVNSFDKNEKGYRISMSATIVAWLYHYGEFDTSGVIKFKEEKGDYSKDNLMWVSKSEHAQHLSYERHSPHSKITKDMIVAIRKKYLDRFKVICSQRSLAEEYGLSKKSVVKVLYGDTTGKIWDEANLEIPPFEKTETKTTFIRLKKPDPVQSRSRKRTKPTVSLASRKEVNNSQGVGTPSASYDLFMKILKEYE